MQASAGAGVAAAIGAALLYNLAVVVQKREAEKVEASGVAILGALRRRPVWLLGIGVQVAGFGLHSFALTRTPVTVVQPIIAAGIGFVVVFAAVLLGERPGAREVRGMAMAVAGVVLLTLGVGTRPTMREVGASDLGLALASAAVLIAALLVVPGATGVRSAGVRAVLIGCAAGLGQGMSDAMNRLAGTWLAPRPGWVPPAAMGLLAVAALVVFGFQGFVSAQNAFRRHRANTVVPCILVAQLLVPLAMGAALYGQGLPEEGRGLAQWSLALALTLGGIATLSGSVPVGRSFG